MLNNLLIQHAITKLNQGGIIAYPTEGVYGLGCDPFNQAACERLANIKQRSKEKAFIVVASRLSQVADLIDHPNIPDWNTITATWPGAITWVVPLSPFGKTQLPYLTSLAIRISAHPTVITLCEQFNKPMTSTSANIANQPALTQYDDVVKQFSACVDCIIPGRIGTQVGPTPIYDGLTKQQLR